MDAEPCKNYELKGGLKMQKIFMTAKEVQDFLEVSRTTSYQLINEMNQELTKLSYRVQRGKVNRQYFMEKYCYGNEVRKEIQGWMHIERNKNGTWYCKFSYVNWKGGEKSNRGNL